jgi:hypothetical protein
MIRSAYGTRGIVDRSRPGFGQCDQLLHGLYPQRWMHDENIGDLPGCDW